MNFYPTRICIDWCACVRFLLLFMLIDRHSTVNVNMSHDHNSQHDSMFFSFFSIFFVLVFFLVVCKYVVCSAQVHTSNEIFSCLLLQHTYRQTVSGYFQRQHHHISIIFRKQFRKTIVLTHSI